MDGLIDLSLFVAAALAVWISLTPARQNFRRWLDSRRVHSLLRCRLSEAHYEVLRDVRIRVGDPARPVTVQLGHVVVSPYGIFVIETQRLSGRIRGRSTDRHWLGRRLGRGIRISNPLFSLRTRAGALRDTLGLETSQLHAVMVLTGRAKFSEPMPACVTAPDGLIPYIQVRTSKVLGFGAAERALARIESLRPQPGSPMRLAHLHALRERHSQRFGARQAVLGLALMAALVAVTGTLVQHLAEVPGRFPTRDVSPGPNPFADSSNAPRVELPGISGRLPLEDQASPGPVLAPGVPSNLKPVGTSPHGAASVPRDLASGPWLCTYSAAAQSCSCYEPNGGKAHAELSRCQMVADTGPLARTSPP